MKNVLFLCTGNSARSVMAEALLAHLGRGRYATYSAGSTPTGAVNPLTLKTLAAHGLPTDGYRSKTWDEFSGPDAPSMDLVVTVCSNAKNEVCPIWPGVPIQVHWGFEDPAAAEGDETARMAVFEEIFQLIKERLEAFVETPFDTTEDLSAREEMARSLE